MRGCASFREVQYKLCEERDSKFAANRIMSIMCLRIEKFRVWNSEFQTCYIYIHCCFVPRLRIFEIDFASHPDSIPFQCRVTSVPR